jgi:hypothetical protein
LALWWATAQIKRIEQVFKPQLGETLQSNWDFADDIARQYYRFLSTDNFSTARDMCQFRGLVALSNIYAGFFPNADQTPKDF